MMIEFGQAITPLLSKEKVFVFSKYFHAYYDLMQSVEFFYKENNDTYYFLCATDYIETILDSLAELSLENPCALLSNYIDNCHDLDFDNPEKSIIYDKDNLIQNIQSLIAKDEFVQNYRDKEDLISVCHYLIEFVELSKNNELTVQYG